MYIKTNVNTYFIFLSIMVSCEFSEEEFFITFLKLNHRIRTKRLQSIRTKLQNHIAKLSSRLIK